MDSCVVPHRSTNRAVLWLTAQIGRDAVLSESYGHRHLPYWEVHHICKNDKCMQTSPQVPPPTTSPKYKSLRVPNTSPFAPALKYQHNRQRHKCSLNESQEFVGWTSADRSTQATLPLTVPRSTFKSSACDSSRTHDRFNWWTARVHLPGPSGQYPPSHWSTRSFDVLYPYARISRRGQLTSSCLRHGFWLRGVQP